MKEKISLICFLFLFASKALYAQSAMNLGFGPAIHGYLDSRDTQIFNVRSATDGFAIVETFGDNDTFLEVFDADNKLILDNDDGGDETNSRVGFFVKAGRTYRVKLSLYNVVERGEYQIQAILNPMPQAAELAVGRTLSSNLSAAGDNWYRVRAARAGNLVVETASRIDTYLEAYDMDGKLLAQDDDGGDTSNARLEIAARAGDVFLFRLRGYDRNEYGAYTITASMR
jgi:serine protease Do